MPGEQTEGRREGLAHMRLHVSRGVRADRQGVQLVKDNIVGGSVDSVLVVLSAIGDMLFVGSCTRLQADEV